uniref:Uncharacterized protein n=1 Tax=viral metagenome TaxID=1070528 RepID=A0A6C0APE2_9ZZZZ
MAFCGPTPILYNPLSPPSPTCTTLLYPSTSPFVVGPPPDPSFFNINGIYALRFIEPYYVTFNSLKSYIQSSSVYTDISNLIQYPDPYSYQGAGTTVKYMSQQQKQQYEDQLTLFRQVYAYNLAAYNNAAKNGTVPIYYRFLSSSQLQQYTASLSLVNKLYNVNEIFPYTCLFYLPFPPFCNP